MKRFKIGQYAKEIVATLVAAAGVLYKALEDNQIEPGEAVLLFSTLVLGFAAIAASSPWKLGRYMKAVAAGLVAAFSQLAFGLFYGGLTAQDVLGAIIAAAAASGLGAIVPNAAKSDVYRTPGAAA